MPETMNKVYHVPQSSLETLGNIESNMIRAAQQKPSPILNDMSWVIHFCKDLLQQRAKSMQPPQAVETQQG